MTITRHLLDTEYAYWFRNKCNTEQAKDFLQQFQYNAENLLKLLDDIPRLKRMVRHAR